MKCVKTLAACPLLPVCTDVFMKRGIEGGRSAERGRAEGCGLQHSRWLLHQTHFTYPFLCSEMVTGLNCDICRKAGRTENSCARGSTPTLSLISTRIIGLAMFKVSLVHQTIAATLISSTFLSAGLTFVNCLSDGEAF